MIASFRQRRAGFSLVELLVVISVSATLIVMLTAWIGQAFRFHQEIAKQKKQHQQLSRLGRMFREHVWEARSAEWLNLNHVRLEGTHTIEYKIDGNRLTVTQTGDASSIETFRLAKGTSVQFEQGTGRDTLGLRVMRPQVGNKKSEAGTHSKIPVDLYVVARLNRWPNVVSAERLLVEPVGNREGGQSP